MKEIEIDPYVDLVFSQKVIEQCKNCKRYGKKATCPPYIASWRYYSELLPTYKHGLLIFNKYKIENEDNWIRLGRESSEEIRKALLSKRLKLINSGHYFAIAFGAGSCKSCDQCTFPCRHPDTSLIPIEATGLNIVEMMRMFKIKIKHPIDKYFYRVGGIFYD